MGTDSGLLQPHSCMQYRAEMWQADIARFARVQSLSGEYKLERGHCIR